MDDVFNHDVSFHIMDYLVGEYIFVGSVNRKSRDFFKNKLKNTVTNVSSCFESVEKLKQSGILERTKEIRLEPYVYNSPSTEVLEYAEKNKVVYSINGALSQAIRRMDFKVIDWMEDRFELHGPSCMIGAVESGSLDMVKRYCIDNLLDYRAHNFFPDGAHLYNFNDRDRMEVCSNWRAYVGDYLLEAVKSHGYFDIMKWLHTQGIPDPEECCGVVGDATLTCSEEMIVWMVNQGYVMNVSDLPGNMGIVSGSYMRWLREMGSH